MFASSALWHAHLII